MKAAILGFGTVGSGAYEVLQGAHPELAVKRVLDLRVPPGFEGIVTTRFEDILADDEIGVVAEAMGGLHPAYEYVSACLRAGKHVVSANKHLICHYYRELSEAARAAGVTLRFTAAAGGGIPWLYNLRRTLRCDRVTALRGILNGTTNYILDAMQTLGSDFDDVLAAAQKLGYAEADPSADIDGPDVRRKCAISASIAFDAVFTEEDVPTFGIRHITARDVEAFASLGLVCRLLAYARREGDAVCPYVEPTLLPRSAVESAVGTNFNCVSLWGEAVGRLTFMGQGAGKYPTGHALASDMLDAAAGGPMAAPSLTRPQIDHTLHPHRYYIRTGSGLVSAISEHTGPFYALSRPLTVAEAHTWYDRMTKDDPQTFIAGMEDDIE